ncbi:hypothetical protein SNOG_10571 [Parastagonospora nodorum SN15]|uniref:CsbD-like domain-containing protein n=1 Tax=Phaeosphaeria nodorum (strain SN15 / ATCC MYA-4574 / FGSC 10173) TaxID=321614 RepID=Q0UCE3_PHANO|nr:hypothetical protein SNOG_10571 [Parastagonospora nodorum SN15]EAT81965.2 hypothetical protein SNOG_10571 [Parastagonospora nodorum SN15]
MSSNNKDQTSTLQSYVDSATGAVQSALGSLTGSTADQVQGENKKDVAGRRKGPLARDRQSRPLRRQLLRRRRKRQLRPHRRFMEPERRRREGSHWRLRWRRGPQAGGY